MKKINLCLVVLDNRKRSIPHGLMFMVVDTQIAQKQYECSISDGQALQDFPQLKRSNIHKVSRHFPRHYIIVSSTE